MYQESLESIESKIVRSRTVPVMELREGMRCAADVRTPTGTVILPRDSEIQEKHIEFFTAIGIKKVDVATEKKKPLGTDDTAAEKKEKLKRARVLIVDDSRMMRVSLKKIMESIGMDIVGEAEDGVEAIELARKLSPDIVTLDIKMPRMDGLATVKQLSKEFPRMKKIMVSAEGEEPRILESIKSGASDFIHKPFNPTRVKKSILNAI